jgi:tetratricopeptide (TPR) repeat protein
LRAEPKNAVLHLQIANVLWNNKERARAEACYLKAAQIDPNYAEAFANWGNARRMRGDAKGAIPLLQEATRLDPKSTSAHDLLGLAFLSTGDFERAVAAFERTLRLDPKYFDIDNRLNLAREIRADPGGAILQGRRGGILQAWGDLDGAIVAYREATRLEPKNSNWHNRLAVVLLQKGDGPAALVAACEAVRLNPKFAFARYNQGKALEMIGDLAGAGLAFRRALEVLPPNTTERAVIVQQALAVAWDFQARKQMHVAAVRLYVTLFACEPKLVSDLQRPVRYNAACSAAQAAAGQAKDADDLDAKERQHLRRQALDWLRADLDAWDKLLADAKPPDKQRAREGLEHWQKDEDFISVRDEKALSALTAEERDAWKKLWADVAALLNKAKAP